MRAVRRVLAVLAAMVATAPLTTGAGAQPAGPIPRIEPPTRAAGAWTSFDTEHFTVHSRLESRAWARMVAQRLEGIRAAVEAMVGHAPDARVTVLVDDPQNSANGNAISWLDAPQIALYPVPPDPRSQLGRARDWAELLTVHEFAHVAHLARDSRRGGGWFGWLPGRFGPLSGSPRWVREGYATLVEGRLTGSGRPSSPLRAAVLREWAAEGLLPSYGALNGSSAYEGGRFAYLMGSAFLEHLERQYGDSTLPDLWRRSSARTKRSFGGAFVATYGDQPSVLYARYAAQLTANAVLLQRALDSAPPGAGLVEGRLEARLERGSGDPAISPDGSMVAIALEGAPGRPDRLVVWSTDTTPDAVRDSTRRAATVRLAERDPEDRLPVPQVPTGRRALHTLRPTGGASYVRPRWLPDGKRLLVVRADFQSDGSIRPDLYEWTLATGAVRRITNGESVRDADPLPDGTHAVGSRCLNGQCDLVRIHLASGKVETLVAGDLYTQYTRPRAVPNSVNIAASVQQRGRWRPVLVHSETGAVTPVDGAETPEPTWDRYDVTPTRDGQSLLYVSEETGIPQLVRHGLQTNSMQQLSRVFSAAMAPEPFPGDSALLYLTLDARGYELRRLPTPSAGIPPASSVLSARLVADGADAVVRRQPRSSGMEFDTSGTVTPRAYGIGSPRTVMLPIGGSAVDGGGPGGLISRADPVGRFAWMLLGLYSADALAERGGAARLRARLPHLTLGVDLSANRLGFTGASAIAVRDAVRGEPAAGVLPLLDHVTTSWRGVAASAALSRRDLRGMSALRIGASAHDVRIDATVNTVAAGPEDPMLEASLNPRANRWHGFLEAAHTLAASRGAQRLNVDLRGHLSISQLALAARSLLAGPTTSGVSEPSSRASRGMMQANVDLSLFGPVALQYSGLLGAVNNTSPYEQFAVGGMPSLLMSGSVMPQRVPVPWLGAGTLQGRDVALHTVRWPSPVGVTPFFSAVRSGGPWHRAAGVSVDLSRLPDHFYRVPGVEATGGVAYLLDVSGGRRVRGWAGVTFRP